MQWYLFIIKKYQHFRFVCRRHSIICEAFLRYRYDQADHCYYLVECNNEHKHYRIDRDAEKKVRNDRQIFNLSRIDNCKLRTRNTKPEKEKLKSTSKINKLIKK
jgi:hypothetical protein